MKTVDDKFKCEICETLHSNESSAIKCESMGVFSPEAYPAGLMIPKYRRVNGVMKFIGIFAIPETPKARMLHPHIGYTRYWSNWTKEAHVEHYVNAFVGDLVGGDYLHSDKDSVVHWISKNFFPNEYINSAEFSGMVEYLKSYNIAPSYYDEQGQLNIVK